MYVQSKTPTYVCPKCLNKIPIVDLEGIFCDEIQQYSLSADRIAAYIRNADGTVVEKQNLLQHQEAALKKTQQEINRVYRLYQDGQLDSAGFGQFYQPLEERRKQLEADIPRLRPRLTFATANNLSAEEIVAEAQNLHRLWPTLEPAEKRKIVEAITLCYIPSCKELPKRWRKGEDSNLR